MRNLLSGLALLWLIAPAPAAPPTVQWLWPGGAQRGTTVELQAGPTFPRWPARLHAADKGITFAPGKNSGIGTLTIAADAAPGLHWLRFHDDDGAAALRPFLVGTLPEITETEPNDDFRKPQPIAALPVTINGRLQRSGDVDCFAVNLKKGQTLVASVEAHRTLGSPMDAVLQVTSPDGFVLADNHDYHELDPQLAYTAAKDGPVIVRVYAFPSAPDSSIAFSGANTYVYRLTLTTGAFAEYAWPLAVPRAAPGVVELVGWNLPQPAPRLPVTPTDADAALVWKPEIANPVPVQLEPHATTVETKPAGPRPPQAIAAPISVTGRLAEPGEIDVYRLAARKGQPLVIQVAARSLGLPLDPVLTITDPTGKKLAESDDNGANLDPELTFTPPADGDYLVEVRDLHGHGGLRHAYLLRIAPPRPEFTLSVPADALSFAAGKSASVVVTVERRGGMNQPIAIAAEGLPAGVTATAATCAAAAKTVTLTLTAKAAGVSGPLRIVGTAGGLKHAAHAPVAGTAHTSPHLWVAVTK